MENLGYIGAHPRQFSNDICFVLYVWGAIFQIDLSTLKSSCSNEIILHRNTYWFVFDKDIDTEDVFMYIYIYYVESYKHSWHNTFSHSWPQIITAFVILCAYTNVRT